MPNYCENVVLFRSHDSAIINKLHDAVCERRLFGFIKPEPKHESLDAETQWREEHWGTKHELMWPHVTVEPGLLDNGQWEFEARFETAWGPPVELMEFASKLWPDVLVELAYYEPGLAFCGFFDGGEEVGHWQLEGVDISSEETIDKSLEHLPEVLVSRLMLRERFVLDMQYEKHIWQERWERLEEQKARFDQYEKDNSNGI